MTNIHSFDSFSGDFGHFKKYSLPYPGQLEIPKISPRCARVNLAQNRQPAEQGRAQTDRPAGVFDG